MLGTTLILSELWKQYTLTYVLNSGVYQWSYIPFQLCSMPMYLCVLIYVLRKTRIREVMIGFLADYSLMSGLVTFLDTTGLHYGYAPLTVHSYLWHVTIACIGAYSGVILHCRGKSIDKNVFFGHKRKKQAALNDSSEQEPGPKSEAEKRKTGGRYLGDFVPETVIFLTGCAIAEIINLSFDKYGVVDMFYINPHYYLNQIVFNDLTKIIPNNVVIVLYILCVIAAAFLVHLGWMLFDRKAGK